ncbi:hypothetical protein [uncultured Clostridium sp.]|jgi:hypothetical protein|uniref:hypothetical protein n=1 Tax=uncultured Clostridium sp. TaxID=59620 RepID=UPI00262FE3E3|nr:hypothetical protein [uncultured Clostridium sp.]
MNDLQIFFDFLESIKEVLLVALTWILTEYTTRKTEERVLKRESQNRRFENLKNYSLINPLLVKASLDAESNFVKISLSELRQEVSLNINTVYLLEKENRNIVLEINKKLLLQGQAFTQEAKDELENHLKSLAKVFREINKEIV